MPADCEQLWRTTHAIKSGHLSLNEVQTCPGFHPLCDWCEHAEGCPKFAAFPVTDPALDTELAEFSRLKAEKAALEEEIEAREVRIRRLCQHANTPTGWPATDRFRFRTARIAGRRNLDPARLRADLTSRLGAAEADALLTNATVTGAAYERLTVSPRKDPIS